MKKQIQVPSAWIVQLTIYLFTCVNLKCFYLLQMKQCYFSRLINQDCIQADLKGSGLKSYP